MHAWRTAVSEALLPDTLDGSASSRRHVAQAVNHLSCYGCGQRLYDAVFQWDDYIWVQLQSQLLNGFGRNELARERGTCATVRERCLTHAVDVHCITSAPDNYLPAQYIFFSADTSRCVSLYSIVTAMEGETIRLLWEVPNIPISNFCREDL